MRAGTTTRNALLFCGVALIPGLILGCGKGSGNANAGASANAADTSSAAATANRSGNTASAAGASTGARGSAEVAPSAEISGWNDDNIVAKVATSDRGEVQLGRLAASKAVIPAVKSYAKMLVSDHSKGEAEVRSLESKAKLAAKPASDDTTGKANQDLMRKFQAMPAGKDWDSTFVQHEFDDHQHDIADTRAMQNQAKDAQLKQLLGNELPVLQKHLDSARTLLGYTPGGSSAWHNMDFKKTEPAKPTKR